MFHRRQSYLGDIYEIFARPFSDLVRKLVVHRVMSSKNDPSPYRKPWEPLLLRLLPEQRKKLAEAARRLGVDMTNFIRAAALERAKEILEEDRGNEERENGYRSVAKSIELPAWAANLTPRREEQTAPTASVAPTVIVQTAMPTTDDALRLLDWVSRASNTIERAERERMAIKIVRESANEAADRDQIVRAFEEKLASKQASFGKKFASWLTRK